MVGQHEYYILHLIKRAQCAVNMAFFIQSLWVFAQYFLTIQMYIYAALHKQTYWPLRMGLWIFPTLKTVRIKCPAL